MEYYKRERERERREKMVIQKRMGLAMIILSFVAFYIASIGTTVVDKDSTAAVTMLLIGAVLLFTKENII